MEQMEQQYINVKDEMREVCKRYVWEKCNSTFSINYFTEDEREELFEEWGDLCLLNYLRAYFRNVSVSKCISEDKKVLKRQLKERIRCFDEVIRNEKFLKGSHLAEVKKALEMLHHERSVMLKNQSYGKGGKKLTYGTMAESLIKFFMRTGQRIRKTEALSVIDVNWQLLLPLTILTVIYERDKLGACSHDFNNMGEEIFAHYYSTRSVQECRMPNTVEFILKCIAELLYYNEEVVNNLTFFGFDVTAESGNCLCEATEYYSTMLMEQMESGFIDILSGKEVFDEEDNEFEEDEDEVRFTFQAIADIVIGIELHRISENIVPVEIEGRVYFPTGKKDDPNRNYMQLISNGFKKRKKGFELTDDIKPLLNRLLKYFSKDKDSISPLFSRYSSETGWTNLLNSMDGDVEKSVFLLEKLFIAICLVEFGLQFGGTMEQPLFYFGISMLYHMFTVSYFANKEKEENEEVVKAFHGSNFCTLCEWLPNLQKELQEPSREEIEYIFQKYITNGRIREKILTEMYFDKPSL